MTNSKLALVGCLDLVLFQVLIGWLPIAVWLASGGFGWFWLALALMLAGWMADFGCCPVVDPGKSGWQIIIWLGTCFRVPRFSGPLSANYHKKVA